jgi:hypothetical protein
VIAWHLRHAANCGCHGIPSMVLAQLEARHNRLPPDYELAWSARGTMGLPVAPEAGLVAASAANTLRRTGIEL